MRPRGLRVATARGAVLAMQPRSRTWVHVRTGALGWVDDVTVPGTARPHPAGTWLMLPAATYAMLRAARVEEVERVLVPRTHHGRPYLHAITLCGRLVASVERVDAAPLAYNEGMPTHSAPAPRQYDPAVRAVVRRGCGCRGARNAG